MDGVGRVKASTQRRPRIPMVRKTAQREAIHKAIAETANPLQVSDILERAQRHMPSINQATVYRNVKRLVEEGWLRRVDHPSLGTLYERAGKPHHHHFHCLVCNRLIELPGCAVDQAEDLPPGFSVEGHELFLFGTCAECSGRG